MSVWDDRILEILNNEGPQTPSKLAQWAHIKVGTSNISRRLSKLADHDLVEPLGNGVYQITREGRIYLVGGLDAESGEIITDIEGEGLRQLD